MIKFLLMCVFISITFNSSTAVANDKKNILILNSYHAGFTFSDLEMEGINQFFKPRLADFDITQVFMDSKRFSLEQIEQYIYRHFIEKKYKIDLLLTLDDNALTFALKYRDELFPDIPIVFAGVNRFEPERFRGVKNITGAIEVHPIKQNLELILRLHPNIKELVIIGDSTESSIYDTQNMMDALQQVPAYKNIKVTIKSDWTLASIDRYLHSLDGSDTVVYEMDFLRDRDGVLIRTDYGSLYLDKFDNVPFYSNTTAHFDAIVGGYLLDEIKHGYRAAEMAYKVLTGTPINDIHITLESESKIMFNYRKLKQFNISIASLPPNSVIKGKPIKEDVTITYILFSFISVQILLIGVFLYVLLKQR